MRHTVSKCTPNRRACPSSPSHLSYWRDNMPSGWSVAVPTIHFSISVVPHIFCCHTKSPPPPYPSLLSRIYATVLVRRCLLRWTFIPPPLSWISTAPPLSSSCVSVAISSHYPLSSCVLRHRCLSTFSDRIFSSLCVVLYYTACSNLTRTTFLTLRSDLLNTIFFSILARLFYLSVTISLRSDLLRFSPLAFSPLCSNMIIPLSSVCSDLLALSLIYSTMIAPLMLWSFCSDLLGSYRSDLLCLSFLCTF